MLNSPYNQGCEKRFVKQVFEGICHFHVFLLKIYENGKFLQNTTLSIDFIYKHVYYGKFLQNTTLSIDFKFRPYNQDCEKRL